MSTRVSPMNSLQNHATYGGRGPEIIGVAWFLLGITTLVIGSRLLSCMFTVKKASSLNDVWTLGWVLLAWFFGVVGTSFLTVAVHFGLGNHVQTVTAQGSLSQAMMYKSIWATFDGMMVPVAKFSVVALLFNIIGPSNSLQKQILIFLVGSNFVFSIVSEFLCWFQCNPHRKLWDLTTEGVCPLSKINYHYTLFSGSWDAFVNLYLSLYAAYLVCRLSVPRGVQVALGIPFGLGIFATVCSCMKTFEFRNIQNGSDTTHDVSLLIIWTIAESWVILIASGLPAIWSGVKQGFDRVGLHWLPSAVSLTDSTRNLSKDSGHTDGIMGKRSSQASTLYGSSWCPREKGKISVTREVIVNRIERHEKEPRTEPSGMRTWGKDF